uniref:Uncharacterized protein n=1 Tax=Caenorhabditis japonica TaxID=281687 RepID=A0A8R1DXC9_CAEJA
MLNIFPCSFGRPSNYGLAKTLLKIPLDVRAGWLVSDLQYQKLISEAEIAHLQSSLYSGLFQVEDGVRVTTNSTISHLRGELFELFLNVQEGTYHRLVTLHIYVDPTSSLEFLTPVYHATVYPTRGSEVIFSTPIALKNSTDKLEISSLTITGPFTLSVHGKSVKLHFSEPQEAAKIHVIYLGAFLGNMVVAQCKIVVEVLDSERFLLADKKFKVEFTLGTLPGNFTVFDVQKRNPSEPLLFHLEQPSRFFKICQLTGRVSTLQTVGYGVYHVHVVARNQRKQRSDAWLEILVLKKFVPAEKSRSRRHLDDVVFKISENTPVEEIERKQMKIPLFPGETVGEVSVAKDLLRIDEEGRIHVLKPLNFEKTSSIIATVPINGLQSR